MIRSYNYISLLFSICALLLLSSCSVNSPDGSDETCGTLSFDTVRYDMTFFASGKLKNISNMSMHLGLWNKNGFNYGFYKNGHLSEVTFYDNGAIAPFTIKFNDKGDLTQLISNDGQDMMTMIEKNVKNSIDDSLSGTFVVGSYSPNGFLRVYYEIPTGEISKIEEQNEVQTGADPDRGTKTYWIFKHGLQLILNSNRVISLRNYFEDKKNGESLIFNQKGRVVKFYYTSATTFGIAYSVKDLNNVVTAKACAPLAAQHVLIP